jgi:hypothetical protein
MKMAGAFLVLFSMCLILFNLTLFVSHFHDDKTAADGCAVCGILAFCSYSLHAVPVCISVFFRMPQPLLSSAAVLVAVVSFSPVSPRSPPAFL